ncbi:hypothetical protein TIFTF001_055716 [Ficus carica]|uniref:Uncharacterized protein n=1 Tax=Ficus carica TaxID=3494 RepID=A0AA87ZE26_FICCA|nr:hypothetical protein TIFTF001_041515 [Ficus carica]GMN71684.1 hypothetical protein TIFTF001_054633 [Ficus carica]GMN72695.1 hypothetical protein TIFTF001_055273 [Ficus carica]GMN73339.1 hypothetical protein TIFTF001_055714 [Ficus carica]GMN73346.1 hypothetical protein TIFTF001_055716 [Ficus carica]
MAVSGAPLAWAFAPSLARPWGTRGPGRPAWPRGREGNEIKVCPVRPPSLSTIRADGLLGAIRLGKIAPRPGDLMASPA